MSLSTAGGSEMSGIQTHESSYLEDTDVQNSKNRLHELLGPVGDFFCFKVNIWKRKQRGFYTSSVLEIRGYDLLGGELLP